MNQEILTLIEGADPFVRSVLLKGLIKNCEFWGRKSAERMFELEEKLHTAAERDYSDGYTAKLQAQYDQCEEQIQTLRKLYRAANKAL